LSEPTYRIEARLGRGGMGVVDLAVAPDGTRVALKRLAVGGSAAALREARARIRREAEVLGRLDHPRIVPLLDLAGGDDDLVLVMPWYRGGSLDDRVAEHGPLPATEVDHIADHLLGALAAAHRAGVVHRDVKPSNILFDDASRPHLADFGVATARDVTAGLTADGRTIGTPGFMAPEQARGEPAGPAADVFSLGATLRWAVTGAGPYGEGGRDVLLWRAANGMVEPAPADPTVPERLRRRIDAMLAADPAARPTAAALAGGPDGTVIVPTPATPATPPTTPPDAGRRRRITTIVAAVAVAVGLAGGVTLAIGLNDDGGGDDEAATTTPTTAACQPLPYQPCGGPVAPGTDGNACIDERADYDGDATNGCEAAPDALDGTGLGRVEPTIVPVDDVDEFIVEARDGFQFLCDGTMTFDLTAPVGMSLKLTVIDDGGEVLGEVTSADGVSGPLEIEEPSCGGNDSGTLRAVVTPVGSDRVAAPYVLERSGNW
jgi:hypothetical protein